MHVEGYPITPTIGAEFNIRDYIICPITNRKSDVVWLTICSADTGEAPEIPVTYAVVENFLLSMDTKYRISYEVMNCVFTIDKSKDGRLFIQAQDEDYQGAMAIHKDNLVKLFKAISEHLKQFH